MRYYRYFVITTLLILVVVLVVLSMYYGGNAKSITLKDTTDFILYESKVIINSVYRQITGEDLFYIPPLSEEKKFKYILLREVRFPPIFGAIIVGITLSACGLMLQTLFRNLLASPYTTGISSGVLFAVTLVIFIDSVAKLFSLFPIDEKIVAGWCGGILSLIILLIIALRVEEVNGVLIVALLFSYLFTGISSYLVANGEELSVIEYYMFMIGNLTRVNIHNLLPLTVVTLIFLIGSVFLVKPLNALLFGESYARSFGLDVKKVRILILLLTSFVVGAIVPYLGLMAFVGIAAPYMARVVIKTSDHRWLLPTTMLLGIILMLVAHLISLKYWVPIHYLYGINRPAQVLPVGSILEIIGGLLVIYLVYRGEKSIRIQ